MSGGTSLSLKSSLRATLRNAIRSVPDEVRQQASAAAAERLLRQPVWERSRAVLFYLPLQDELDLRACVEQGLAEGKTIAVPRFVREEGSYCAAVLQNLSDDLSPGPFGILEPAASVPVLPLKQLDLALVPGLGFTPGGCRLGRGKGFYDRLLAEVIGKKCGVALDEQVVETMPSEPHDVLMNFILTPTRWLAAGPDS